jgi:CheY-like chemotaxis protein
MPPKYLSTTPSGNSQSRAVPSRDLILVADDDPTVRSYIKTVLESGGFAILEASDGAEALELFRKSCDAIALVISR